MIGRLPLDEQLGALREVLSRNDALVEVLARTETLGLPGWYLTAGCLFQTVRNVVTDRAPTGGIKDYDVFYFDDGDLSWEAEGRAILHRGGDRQFRGDDMPFGCAPGTGRRVAGVRTARAVRPVQLRRPAEPGAFVNPHAGALPGADPGRAPSDQLTRRLPAMAFKVSSRDFFGGSS